MRRRQEEQGCDTSNACYNTVRVVVPRPGGNERDEEEGLHLAAHAADVARPAFVARAGDRRLPQEERLRRPEYFWEG